MHSSGQTYSEQPRRILCVMAHPDDESLSCGGVLARHVSEGDDVIVVVLSDGVGSRLERHQSFEHASAKNRRALHFHAACDALGIAKTNRQLLSIFPDQRSDEVSQLEINRAVEALIAQYQPWRVYTHFAGDINLDHRRVSEAVQVATRGVCEVWCVEPEWPSRWIGRPFASEVRYKPPTEMVMIKLKACAKYEDEIRTHPHPRSLRTIEQRTISGEAFEVIR